MAPKSPSMQKPSFFIAPLKPQQRIGSVQASENSDVFSFGYGLVLQALYSFGLMICLSNALVNYATPVDQVLAYVAMFTLIFTVSSVMVGFAWLKDNYYAFGKSLFLAFPVVLYTLVLAIARPEQTPWGQFLLLWAYLPLIGLLQQALAQPFSQPTAKGNYYLLEKAFKFVVDKIAAVVCIMLTAPLLFITAAAIYYELREWVIFTQVRTGENEKPFKIYKFKSMKSAPQKAVLDAEKVTSLFNAKDDERISKVGKLIRKLHIDELPQFFNVLLGQMTFVGPRPFVPAEFDAVNSHGHRGKVRPGLTGMWQVTGRTTGERRCDVVESLDNQYIHNWCFWLDVSILLRTVPVLLFCKGGH